MKIARLYTEGGFGPKWAKSLWPASQNLAPKLARQRHLAEIRKIASKKDFADSFFLSIFEEIKINQIMKKSFYPESLNSDQLEILKFLNEKEEKREKIISGIIGFILLEIAIILPIALIYFSEKGLIF